MSHVSVSLGHLFSKMPWKAEEPSHEPHRPQYARDVSFVSESCPPKWYILGLGLSFKEVWSNITKSLIDAGYFCSNSLSPPPEDKPNESKKSPPNPRNKLNVLTKKIPKDIEVNRFY